MEKKSGRENKGDAIISAEKGEGRGGGRGEAERSKQACAKQL